MCPADVFEEFFAADQAKAMKVHGLETVNKLR